MILNRWSPELASSPLVAESVFGFSRCTFIVCLKLPRLEKDVMVNLRTASRQTFLSLNRALEAIDAFPHGG
jgi:hypothetical protein